MFLDFPNNIFNVLLEREGPVYVKAEELRSRVNFIGRLFMLRDGTHLESQDAAEKKVTTLLSLQSIFLLRHQDSICA